MMAVGTTPSPSNESTLYDVVIVGAGPAGSSLAASLAEHGWHVLLVEREQLPHHKVCGEFISPDAQLALDILGLYDEVSALGPVPLYATEVTSRLAGKLCRPLPGVAWGLSRYTFDAGLAAAAVARGAELRTATTVTRLIRHDSMRGGHVELHLHHRHKPTRVYARAVVMAFGRVGLPGLTARPTAPGVPGHARYVGVKCHFAEVYLHNRVELYFFPGGYAGLNPVEGGHANLCVLASYEAFTQAGRSISGMLEAAIEGNQALAKRMAGAQAIVETECAVAPVDTHRRAQPWGEMAHLGDSAVMLPPLCGDGMAMALQSARLCAPLADAYLRGHISLGRWKILYRRAWSQEFRKRVWLGRRLQQLLQVPILAEGLLLTGTLFPTVADYFIASTRGQVPTASVSPPRAAG
ncbi:MAG: FAD-dependent monooxygenase [Caldilineaceae bacterium]|nr:FAD-dependent monooxygenase [Caldilineaceae bacterium]